MPSFSSIYTPPGAYVKFLRENLSPNLTASYRIPAFVGTGITEKKTQRKLTRGSTNKDTIPVPAVTDILRIGNTDLTEDYREGVDYELGTGLDTNKIVWTTPGTVVTGAFTVSDLDFGNLSSIISATRVDNLINDSYVFEITASGEGSTKGRLTAGSDVANNLSVSETVTVVVAGDTFNVALTSGDNTATVLSKFQASLDGVATVSFVTSTSTLKFVTDVQGSDATIVINVVSLTLKTELGLSNGTSDTFTYVPGVSGTGQISITARSSRETNFYEVGENIITDIPGLEVTVLSTDSHPVGERAEIITEADIVAKNPLEGSTYFVTVVSQKQVGDYELQYFTREEEDVLYQIYGDPSPENTISLSAYVAFRNLVDIIGVVQLQGGDDLAHFQQGIDKLIDKPVYYVVPLTSDPQVHAYTKFHVNQQSDILQRRERVAILGGAAGYSIFDHTDSAKALNDERIVWVAPSAWQIAYVDTSNVSKIANVDGAFGAVAVASIAAIRDPATPLTRKQIVGVSPLVTYNTVQQNLLAADGCLVISTFGGVSRVRHQLTTYATGPIESKELSVVQLRDHVSVILRNNLEDEFPGQKILRITPQLVVSFTERILEGLVQQEIINGFADVKATQNDIDPTEIDISFSCTPVYPFNYALVTFKFVRQAQISTL